MSDKAMSLADARKDAIKASAARERLTALFDPDSFVEVGALVKTGCGGAGVITGYGLIQGSPVYAFSQDITEKSGAVGAAHGSKIKKIYELACKTGSPVVGIYDSNGAALGEGLDALAAYGEMLAASSSLSGVVPQISLVLGVCAGSAAILAGSADFVILSEQAEFFLNPGDEKALSAQMAAKSGAIHLVEKDEACAIAAARSLIGLLPSNNLSAAPICDFCAPSAAIDPCAENLMDTAAAIVDEGSLIELQKDFCPNSVKVALATLAGSTVGVIAASNNGRLCNNACNKAARFVTICDSFSIPVITLVNAEKFHTSQTHPCHNGVREAAKLVHVYAQATTPKVAVITKKAIGGAYIALAGRASNSDFTIAWPNSVISALSPETAVAFLEGDRITADKSREQVQEEYARTNASPFAAAAQGQVDDVVAPEQTRDALISALDMLAGKRVSTMPRKHGNIPL